MYLTATGTTLASKTNVKFIDAVFCISTASSSLVTRADLHYSLFVHNWGNYSQALANTSGTLYVMYIPV